MMRRFQVFVSSTYQDMRPERQAAVEAILEAGHIPAGMELFAAGDQSQLETVKKWIEDSDVYVLLLGGRYGSIEPESGKSYIHVEYEYAIERGMPVFAVVINDAALDQKVKDNGRGSLEEQNGPALKDFRDKVLSKTSKFFDDPKDIKLAIHQKLSEVASRTDIRGWVRANDGDSQKFADEIAALSQENRELRERCDAAGAQPLATRKFELPADLTDQDLVAVLRSAIQQMPGEQKFSVMFFEHIDVALGLPAGTAKRLINTAISDVYEIAMITENTITLAPPSPLVGIARSRRTI